MARKKVDWEAIGREYRAGQLSVREIARQYDVSDTAIRKKGKERGWQRDLTEEARRQTRAQLQREDAEVDPYASDQERQAVAQAAQRGVQVVRVHRDAIERQRRVAQKLITLVERYLNAADGTSDEDVERVTQLAVWLFPGKGDGLSSLMQAASSSLDRLVRLERKAFNLDEDDGGEDADLVSRLEAAQKRAAGRGA